MNVRLNKFIADNGICSRRKADELIQEGAIKLNGKITYEMGVKIDPLTDLVSYKGKPVNAKKTEKVYIAINKPKNVVTTTSDPLDRTTIMDYFNVKKYKDLRLFPVGRLDWATDGLIFITNDGSFSNEVANPQSKIAKSYLAKLDNKIKSEHLEKLKRGFTIVGGRVKAIDAVRVKHGSGGKYDWVKITITEGKNRQIRKMFEKIGYDVKKLTRISIGGFKLGALKPGQFRELKASEILRVFAKPKPTRAAVVNKTKVAKKTRRK